MSADKKLSFSELSPLNNSEHSTCENFCPIPSTHDFDGTLLWNFFLKKDSESTEIRSSDLFIKSPSIKPKMRSVILEWLMQICDIYKLYRETYFLAVDYLDRYLSVSESITANKLQLISVSCLLIASKFEEICPPRVSELAYLTDGSSSEEDILNTEITIVTAIDWKITVITLDRWLSVFLQILYVKDGDIIIETKFNTELYAKISKLLDLCSLDIQFLNFSYRIIAATAFNLVCSEPSVLVSWGLSCSDIKECSEWLKPFWEILQQKCGVEPHQINLQVLPAEHKPRDYQYKLMKRNISLELLSLVQELARKRS